MPGIPPRQMLLTKLSERFKAAGERLKPTYHVLEEGEEVDDYQPSIKLYGIGTLTENV